MVDTAWVTVTDPALAREFICTSCAVAQLALVNVTSCDVASTLTRGPSDTVVTSLVVARITTLPAGWLFSASV